jgi:hypothetical protein
VKKKRRKTKMKKRKKCEVAGCVGKEKAVKCLTIPFIRAVMVLPTGFFKA